MRALAGLSMIVVSAFALGGCMRAAEEEATSETTTAALSTSQQAGFTQSAIELDEKEALDPVKAADAVATKSLPGLQPAGCIERTRNGAAVHVVLTDCTGPFGKMHVSGSLDVAFSSDGAGKLTADVTGGKDLTLNGRTLAYKAHGSIAFEGSKRKLLWHGESSGTTKRGVAFSRVNDLDIVFDVQSRCIDAAGSSRGKIGKYEIDLTVDGFAVCEGKCPTAGHVVATIDGPRKDRTIEVDFDGTDRAHVKGFSGKRTDIPMACEDGEAAE